MWDVPPHLRGVVLVSFAVVRYSESDRVPDLGVSVVGDQTRVVEEARVTICVRDESEAPLTSDCGDRTLVPLPCVLAHESRVI